MQLNRNLYINCFFKELMVVDIKLLPKLSHIFNKNQTFPPSEETLRINQGDGNGDSQTHAHEVKAQIQWVAAVAALEDLLQKENKGVILSAPAPVLCESKLVNRFEIVTFTPDWSKKPVLMPCKSTRAQLEENFSSITKLSLSPNDPLCFEQFCLALTPNFAVLILLGQDSLGLPIFDFSFDPDVIRESWKTLRIRLLITNNYQLNRLDTLIEEFPPPTPDYKLVMNFSRKLLKSLGDFSNHKEHKIIEINKNHHSSNNLYNKFSDILSISKDIKSISKNKIEILKKDKSHPEVELLQALTHEIRTPLTTIRTLTKLLLKRAKTKLTPDIVQRLESIDRECTEQINRMELIFMAAELENKPSKEKQVHLTPVCLEQLFNRSIPHWQKQAQRRNVTLDVVLPKQLPKVVSDSAILDRVLTGLIEKFIRSLPSGGQIKVEVGTAGNQLKVQFLYQCNYISNSLKYLGQILMFQPETGCLSLNLNVTKNMFQALGGKLTIRQKDGHNEVLTIFLPLGNPEPKNNSNNNNNSDFKVCF